MWLREYDADLGHKFADLRERLSLAVGEYKMDLALQELEGLLDAQSSTDPAPLTYVMLGSPPTQWPREFQNCGTGIKTLRTQVRRSAGPPQLCGGSPRQMQARQDHRVAAFLAGKIFWETSIASIRPVLKSSSVFGCWSIVFRTVDAMWFRSCGEERRNI